MSRCPLLSVLGALFLLTGGLCPRAVQAQATGKNPVGKLQEQFEADSTLPSSSAELVSVDTRLSATPVPAGETVRSAVVLEIQDGWHVNAHRPTYEYLIGTTVEWNAPVDVEVTHTRYPSPARFHLEFAGDTIDVYEDTVAIFTDLRPARSARPGERRLTGALRVQACNDRTCLRPSKINVTVPVPVADVGTPMEPTDDPVFETASVHSPSSRVWDLLRRHGLFVAGGLLVLVTIAGIALYGRVAATSDVET